MAASDLHVHDFGRLSQLTLRPARGAPCAHDPDAPGLHHLWLRVADREAVDAVARGLRERG